jgi:hypothetical protein
MKKFHERTGCPVVVNTSFNLSWEPIVESPAQAYHTFMQSEMDVLVLEDCVLHKPRQPASKRAPLHRGQETPSRNGLAVDALLPDHGRPQLSRRLLRQFAALWLLFCGGLAWLEYAHERWVTALIVAVLGLAFGPLGLCRPQAIRPLYVVLTTITYPIGWVVSQVLLTVLYYGVFTPLGWGYRLLGRDVLRRRPRPDQRSWWTPKNLPADITSYFRQS